MLSYRHGFVLLGLAGIFALSGCTVPAHTPSVHAVQYVRLFHGGVIRPPGQDTNLSNAATVQDTEDSESGIETVRVVGNVDILCRDLAPPTGTRIGKRHVCMPQWEWDYVQQRDAETVRQMQAVNYPTGK